MPVYRSALLRFADDGRALYDDDGLLEALNAAADLSPPDDVEMLPEEEDDNAEK